MEMYKTNEKQTGQWEVKICHNYEKSAKWNGIDIDKRQAISCIIAQTEKHLVQMDRRATIMECGQLDESNIQWWKKKCFGPGSDGRTFIWCHSSEIY